MGGHADRNVVNDDNVSADADCSKMALDTVHGDCTCCNPQAKCPDAATCLLNCAMQVIGFPVEVPSISGFIAKLEEAGDLQAPTGWSVGPPAPPPRG